jgi:hypothetical protein
MCVLLAGHASAGQFHVRQDVVNGDGSRRHPWQLAYALNGPRAVRPGDTVWVHGGTYYGHFTSRLAGTSAKPVIVREYPGERAILDGGNSAGTSVLMIEGSYAWYWGFEVMSSDLNRVSKQEGSYPHDIGRGECVTINQEYAVKECKFINLVLHDGKLGFNAWKPAEDIEVYGCVMFNNGWLASDRQHGHNIYAQNETGVKRFAENILTHAFSHNVQVYGSGDASLDNFDFEGNVIFQAGERNFLVGGGRKAKNLTFKNNFLYESGRTNIFNLGYYEYGHGAEDAVVTGNIITGGELSFKEVTNTVFEGNTLYAVSLVGVSPSRYPDNTWHTKKPAKGGTFVRANYYEPGRANIIVYNWEKKPETDADVSSILRKGEKFVLIDAENYTGPPVLQGTYQGGTIRIPLAERETAKPVGLEKGPAHTLPEFGAFVLLRQP